MLIKSERLARTPKFIGHAQQKALKLLCSIGAKEEPPKGAITSRGVLRKHTLNDLTMSGLAVAKVDPQEGAIIYLPTARGRKALAQAKTAKKPPTGWHKVRRGRPAKNKAA